MNATPSIIYAVEFDSEDSPIAFGETLYFNNKDNIMPFFIDQLYDHREQVEEEVRESVEDYIETIKDCPPYYITKIYTID